MPGFRVNKYGDDSRLGSDHPNSGAEFYTTYSWEIEQLFDVYAPTGSYLPIIYLRDATLPTMNINKETVMGASLEYKFAKSVSWEDIRLIWYDSVGLLKIIDSWSKHVWTPNTGIRSPNSYKRTSILKSYLDSGEDTGPSQIYTLHNSWPSIIRHGDLTYTTSDIKVVEVTLTYDWAELSIEEATTTTNA